MSSVLGVLKNLALGGDVPRLDEARSGAPVEALKLPDGAALDKISEAVDKLVRLDIATLKFDDEVYGIHAGILSRALAEVKPRAPR